MTRLIASTNSSRLVRPSADGTAAHSPAIASSEPKPAPHVALLRLATLLGRQAAAEAFCAAKAAEPAD